MFTCQNIFCKKNRTYTIAQKNIVMPILRLQLKKKSYQYNAQKKATSVGAIGTLNNPQSFIKKILRKLILKKLYKSALQLQITNYT